MTGTFIENLSNQKGMQLEVYTKGSIHFLGYLLNVNHDSIKFLSLSHSKDHRFLDKEIHKTITVIPIHKIVAITHFHDNNQKHLRIPKTKADSKIIYKCDIKAKKRILVFGFLAFLKYYKT